MPKNKGKRHQCRGQVKRGILPRQQPQEQPIDWLFKLMDQLHRFRSELLQRRDEAAALAQLQEHEPYECIHRDVALALAELFPEKYVVREDATKEKNSGEDGKDSNGKDAHPD